MSGEGGYGEGQLFKTVPNWVVGQVEAPSLNDPMSAYRYLEGRRRVITEAARQRPLLRLWDKNMEYVGQIAQEKSVMVEEVMSEAGAATVVIRRDNWLSDFLLHDRRAVEDVHFTLDPIPTKPDWRTRWGGKLVNCNAKRDAEGLHTVELEMISNRMHLAHLLAGANPIFPPEIQIPKMWMLPFSTRTAISISMWINLARQYFPFLSIPTNILNPGAWLGTGLITGLDPLSWPIQVQFVNPLTDGSRFTVFTSRWTDFHTATAPLLDDAGCMIRAYTWLQEDLTSPHPELELSIPGLGIAEEALHDVFPKLFPNPGTGTLADLARPHRNCIIMAVEDKSGISGPTGTFVDGIINLIASTADDMITEVILPLDKDGDGETDPLVRKWFGVAPDPPWVVFRDGEYSGIIESQQSIHGAGAKTIMVGGKSPSIVNQLQTFGIKYALSQLSQVIGGFLVAYQEPGTPGLEELYQGQLDDCVARDSVIDGPDGKERIDVLAARGGPFRVWSITPDGETVAATATLAFKKGRAELFRFTLEDGRNISVTKDHRFLTDNDYVAAGKLGVGSLVATVDGLRAIQRIDPLGVDDFYDMQVPVWENYLAHGIWHHNTLLAYQRFTDPGRAFWMGDFAFLEHFEQGGAGTAYTVSGIMALRAGAWKTRPFTSFKTSVRNGAPYLLDVDFTLGDRLGFQMANTIHVDQLTGYKRSWDKDSPIKVELLIGDDKETEDPVGKGMRALAMVWNSVGMLLGSGDMF